MRTRVQGFAVGGEVQIVDAFAVAAELYLRLARVETKPEVLTAIFLRNVPYSVQIRTGRPIRLRTANRDQRADLTANSASRVRKAPGDGAIHSSPSIRSFGKF